MTFEFHLRTSPNHQYSDLEAEKLVYKLLTLVLYHRISFRKGKGVYRLSLRFLTLIHYVFFCLVPFQVQKNQ